MSSELESQEMPYPAHTKIKAIGIACFFNVFLYTSIMLLDSDDYSVAYIMAFVAFSFTLSLSLLSCVGTNQLNTLKDEFKIPPQPEGQITARDKYQDLSKSLGSTVCIAVAQLILIGMYTFAAVEGGRPDDVEGSHIHLYYFFGIAMQLGYLNANDIVERTVSDVLFWNVVLSKNAPDGLTYTYNKEELTTSKFEVKCRFVMAVLVNYAILLIVICVLPLQLATSEEPFHFVVNSVVAFVIIDF
jgi:hypothetical protein